MDFLATVFNERLLRLLSVTAIDGIHAVHPPHHASDRGKAHPVETRIVGEVDEHLRRPGVRAGRGEGDHSAGIALQHRIVLDLAFFPLRCNQRIGGDAELDDRSEEHTSELQSLMRISYAVFCLKKKNYK